MRIGELAEKSGLSRDTIRFYERNGLIASTPGASATNNYRDYPEDSLKLLGFLTRARDAGVSIADLRELVEVLAGSCDQGVAETVIRTKIDELIERAAQIEKLIAFLSGTLEVIAADESSR